MKLNSTGSTLKKMISSNVSFVSEEAIKERRYLWMARAFALVAVVALLTNFMLLLALTSLLPLTRVQPFYLYTQDKNEQVIHVRRPSPQSLNVDTVSESLIRQYLLLRLSVINDIALLENIWGIDGDISWSSAPSVFQEFQVLANILLGQARQEGLIRNVKILTLTKFRSERDGSVWRAEVEMSDMKKGFSEPVVTRWAINMKVQFLPNRRGLSWAQRLKNPLGFSVIKFGMQKIE